MRSAGRLCDHYDVNNSRTPNDDYNDIDHVASDYQHFDDRSSDHQHLNNVTTADDEYVYNRTSDNDNISADYHNGAANNDNICTYEHNNSRTYDVYHFSAY